MKTLKNQRFFVPRKALLFSETEVFSLSSLGANLK